MIKDPSTVMQGCAPQEPISMLIDDVQEKLSNANLMYRPHALQGQRETQAAFECGLPTQDI